MKVGFDWPSSFRASEEKMLEHFGRKTTTMTPDAGAWGNYKSKITL